MTLADVRNDGRLNKAVRKSFDLFARLLRVAPLHSKSHLQDHSLRMLNNIPVICHQGFNTKLVEVAIVLHDIGVFYSQEFDHGRVSTFKIRLHLVNEAGLTPSEADKICSMIRSHHEYESPSDNSPEAIALRVLDCLDAFGVIGVYRFLEVYDRRGLSIEESVDAAIVSLDKRRLTVIDSWFHPDDLRIIEANYRRAREIFTAIQNDINTSEEEKFTHALQIIDGLKSIGWEVARLPELFGVGQSVYATSYFRMLNDALKNS